MREHLELISAQAEHWKPEEVLQWAFATFGNDVAIASGFGVEGMVLLDLASHVRRDFRVFTLDTEFLFSETYDLMDRVEKRYGIKVERVYSTLTPEEQEREHGAALWSRNPDQCCNLRKVEPLRDQADRIGRLDYRDSPRSDFVARVRPQGRVGRKIPTGEGQSYRRLEFKDGVGLCPPPQGSL